MTEVEVTETTALQVIQRAEIDSTIATAKNFPRDIKRALDRAEEMATLTEAIAEECHYSLPRTSKGRRVNIQGPSIRFAEILASQWGNLHIAARVIEIGAKQVVAQGACLDLETNVKWDSEVRQSIVSKDGKRYSDDVVTVNANAAAAKAQRNAVLRAIPSPLWRPIYEATLSRIGGGQTPIAESWQRAVAWFGSRGVSEEQLREALRIQKVSELKQADIQTLRGWRNAIEQEATAVEEIFGVEAEQEEAPTQTKKRGRRRRPPREVKATEPDPEPPAQEEPDAPSEENEETDSEETKARKKELVAEWRKVVRNLGREETNEARAAAGVDMVTELCTLAELEACVRKASEIAEGRSE